MGSTNRRAAALATVLAVAIMVPPLATSSAAEGDLLAGAAKTSITARPDDYGGTWETEGCAIVGDDIASVGDHIADFRSSWPENPNCLYMGGFGIGPANPIVAFDEEYGLWVRALAIGNGEDIVVLSVIDGAYYFGEYENFCDTCGAFDLATSLGDELGFDPAGFVLHATHSHASPDFIGAWGGVPDWYFQQVEDAIRSTVREAVASMRPAQLEYGEELARQFNRERRNTYRSAETETLTWLRALAADTGETIATIGAYAGHPTTIGTNDGVAHPDWVGPFLSQIEARFGGLGLMFQTGLGNMSFAGGTMAGAGLADLVPAPGRAPTVSRANIGALRDEWDAPVTNAGLIGLGVPGFFDRGVNVMPATAVVQKGDESRPCTSTSSLSIRTAVSAIHVGPVVFTAGPGELFSNLTNTIKEKSPGAVAFPFAIANDGLGYIVQEFESDHVARQVVGFGGTDFFEYEDAYSLDMCFGDDVLERTLALMAQLEVDPAPAAAPDPVDTGTEGKPLTPTTGGGIAMLVVLLSALFAMVRRRH